MYFIVDCGVTITYYTALCCQRNDCYHSLHGILLLSIAVSTNECQCSRESALGLFHTCKLKGQEALQMQRDCTTRFLNNKSDHQTHSWSLLFVTFDKQYMISYLSSTVTMSLSELSVDRVELGRVGSGPLCLHILLCHGNYRQTMKIQY